VSGAVGQGGRTGGRVGDREDRRRRRCGEGIEGKKSTRREMRGGGGRWEWGGGGEGEGGGQLKEGRGGRRCSRQERRLKEGVGGWSMGEGGGGGSGGGREGQSSRFSRSRIGTRH